MFIETNSFVLKRFFCGLFPGEDKSICPLFLMMSHDVVTWHRHMVFVLAIKGRDKLNPECIWCFLLTEVGLGRGVLLTEEYVQNHVR